MTPARCALASADRGEPLAGTASNVRAFLVVQQEGPWGVDALRDSRLPAHVADQLATRCRQAGVRPLLIRRHRRDDEAGVRVFAAFADPHAPWMETTLLEDVAHVGALDLPALAAGTSPGLSPTSRARFLTCTHGSHDRCCAVEGRPAAAALAAAVPDRAWEVSHIGGDRFAGNVLVLPQGLYYGRMDERSAARMAALHDEGRVALDHLRGRAGLPFAVQAAEHHLRLYLGLDAITDVVVSDSVRTQDVSVATFTTPRGAWRVVVRSRRGAPAMLTCRSSSPRPPVVHELVAIDHE